MAFATASATTSFTSFSSLSSTRNHTRHSPASYVTFRRPLPPISAVYTTADEASVGVASTVSLQTASFYEVLGIQAGASGKEIKAAYRKLARVIHPDAVVSNRQRDATSSSSSSSADEFIRVHEAYATLSDPKKRADYDRMMWVNKGRRFSYSPTYCTPTGANKYGNATTSSSGFSGYTRPVAVLRGCGVGDCSGPPNNRA